MPDERTTIAIGDRFEDKDWRNEGRIVQVRSYIRGYGEEYDVEVEAHPKNPEVVGRRTIVSGKTLRTRYRRISR